MNFSFQNQGFNTFLCYEVAAGKEIDSVTISMLTNNKIQGFAHTTFLQVDEQRFIKYNVSSKVSLKQYFAGVINKDRLLSVFSGITKAFLLADEYMIDTRSIFLSLDYIFVNVSTSEVSLICLPLVEDIESANRKDFFKNIILNNQFDQSENGDYFAKLLNYFNSIDDINFMDFNNLLVSLSGNTSNVSMTPPQVTVNHVNNSSQSMINNVQSVGFTQPNVVVDSATNSTVNVNPTVVNIPNVPVQTEPVHLNKNVGTPVTSVNNNNSNEQKENTSSVPPILSSFTEKKEKKSGGMFSFFNKEKKEKTQKTDKKDEKKNNKNNKKNDVSTYGNIAIPGQIVPPTVKGVEPDVAPATRVSQPSTPTVQPVVQNPVVSTPAQTPVAHNPVVSAPVVAPQVERVVAPAINIAPSAPNTVNFGETTILGGGTIGETTVLSADMNNMAPVPHLIRSKNHERININKPIFRIGKEKSYVDYFIGDNTAISRSHANILSREGKFFIIDTNSTNHTFVNGQMIPSNSELEIVHGTKIRLANEDFEFNLY